MKRERIDKLLVERGPLSRAQKLRHGYAGSVLVSEQRVAKSSDLIN